MIEKLKANLLEKPMFPGETLWDRGFLYTLVKTQPYLNRGKEHTLKTWWLCQCATCGKEFTKTLGARIYNLPRRCVAHGAGQSGTKTRPFKYHPKPLSREDLY